MKKIYKTITVFAYFLPLIYSGSTYAGNTETPKYTKEYEHSSDVRDFTIQNNTVYFQSYMKNDVNLGFKLLMYASGEPSVIADGTFSPLLKTNNEILSFSENYLVNALNPQEILAHLPSYVPKRSIHPWTPTNAKMDGKLLDI